MKIKKWMTEPFFIGGVSGFLLSICGCSVIGWKFWVLMPWIALSNYLVRKNTDL